MKAIVKNFYILIVMLLFACGGSDEFKKNPVDQLITEMDKEPSYTIILHDMDVDEGFLSNTYKHQYQVITEKDSVPKDRVTDWYIVEKDFFMLHNNDLGMELAAKKDGKLSKNVAPAGFSNYVGNSSYGHWVSGSNGDSFWEFYGKYAMMSSLINLATTPIYMRGYNDYRYNYYPSGRAYYGSTLPDGRATYGTNGTHIQRSRPQSKWFSKASNESFRQKVQGQTSRSGSRYNSKSSTRSRSGGFGK